MKLPRRTFLQLAAGAAALSALRGLARAQAYPSRPVRIVVGFTVGSATDITARLFAQKLNEAWKTPVTVEKCNQCVITLMYISRHAGVINGEFLLCNLRFWT